MLGNAVVKGGGVVVDSDRNLGRGNVHHIDRQTEVAGNTHVSAAIHEARLGG